MSVTEVEYLLFHRTSGAWKAIYWSKGYTRTKCVFDRYEVLIIGSDLSNNHYEFQTEFVDNRICWHGLRFHVRQDLRSRR